MRGFIQYIVIILMLFVSFAYRLAAEELVLDTAAVSLTVPDKWTVVEGKKDVEIFSPDAHFAVVCSVYFKKSIEDAESLIMNELAKDYKDIDIKPDQSSKVNGLVCKNYKASATDKKMKLTLVFTLVETPAKNVLLVFTVCETELFAKYENSLKKLLKSVKKFDSKAETDEE